MSRCQHLNFAPHLRLATRLLFGVCAALGAAACSADSFPEHGAPAPTDGENGEVVPGEVAQPINVVDGRLSSRIVAQGFGQGTAMDIAQNGKVFIAEQNGELDVIDPTTGAVTRIYDIPGPGGGAGNISPDTGACCYERGAVGIAVDPDYLTNRYFYVTWTRGNGGAGARNVITRFTVNDAANPTTITANTDLILLSTLGANQNHHGGAIDFHQGFLFTSTGDNAQGNANTTNLSNTHGKVLRYNMDGSIPSDNPFGAANPIWANGFRNAFSFDIAGDGTLFLNDVGNGSLEEINDVQRGGDYCYDNRTGCSAARYQYSKGSIGGCAITGGTFYEPAANSLGSAYEGKFFFGDYCANSIRYISKTGALNLATFATGAGDGLVDLDVGPDGSLYWLSRNGTGQLGVVFNDSTPECSINADCNDSISCTDDTCVSGQCQHLGNGSCPRLEAEASTYINGALTAEAAASAGQFVDGNEGARFTWTTTSTVSAQRTLKFALRAPNGTRAMGVFVNGAKIGVLTTTTVRPIWGSATFATTFLQGSNTIELRDTEGMAEPDVDYLEITGATAPVCGSGGCEAGETCSNCAADCGPCAAVCGSGGCEAGETCSSCAADCGPCAPVCGSGSCEAGETCSSCAADCGPCLSGVPSATYDAVLGNCSNCTNPGAYLDLNAGATLTFNPVNGGNGGNATLHFAIAAPSGVRRMGVFVNGVKVGTVTTTTTRPNLQEQSVSATLNPGANSVQLRDTEGVDEPDVDYLRVQGVSSVPAECGDFVCNGSETCSSCPWDCDTCAGATLGLDARPANGGAGSVTRLEAENHNGYSNPVAGGTNGGLGGNLGWQVCSDTSGCGLNIGWTDAGDWVQWTYVAPTTGTYSITARVASNAMPWSHNVQVDGVTVATNSGTGTGGWQAWSSVQSSAFNMSAGSHTIRIAFTSGGQNLNYIAVDAPAVGSTACVAGSPGALPPANLQDHPCVAALSPLTFSAGVIPYDINQGFWSDGAAKNRYFAIPNNSTISVSSDGDWVLPNGSVTIKTFYWLGALFETRFFVRYSDGSYGGYTYKWTSSSSATLVASDGENIVLPGGQAWQLPAQAQCNQCHTGAAGGHLGLETRQLNGDFQYPATGRTANQFDTLLGVGVLAAGAQSLPPLPGKDTPGVSLSMRAEAYLHVNCANCHRPGGGGQGLADFRYDVPFGGTFGTMNVCNVKAQAEVPAWAGYDLVEPGDPTTSVVSLRQSLRGPNQMPPLASTLVDSVGRDLLEAWITSLQGCP